MKIKTKLTFGITFLFVAFLIVGGSSLFFILNISKQNSLIMKDNHLSIGYCENMLQAIDKIDSIQSSNLFNQSASPLKNDMSIYNKQIEQNLLNEENNITEVGEKDRVEILTKNLDKFKVILKLSTNDSIKDKLRFYSTKVLPIITTIKSDLFAISDLNMDAIVRKNEIANNTIHHSYLILSSFTTICSLVFFLFIFGFPSYIATPIKEMTEGVKEIANRNFRPRVNFKPNDEFGEIANAFNEMASSLEEFQNSNTIQSIHGKERMEAVLDQMKEGLILLDEHRHLIFINYFAETLLNLSRFELLNKYVSEIALHNEVVKFLINDLDQSKNNPQESILLECNGVRTKFIREIHIIRTSKKDLELVVPIGYMIFLKEAIDIK